MTMIRAESGEIDTEAAPDRNRHVTTFAKPLRTLVPLDHFLIIA
ncbi:MULTISPECIES: hypothetical protein [unclassified Streptomyces]|nr:MULTISPECIES: hypothetical protein [unclassified Streptomyces]